MPCSIPGCAMTDAPLVLQPPATRSRSLLQLAMLRLRRNIAAMGSLVVLAAIALVCVFGPLMTPHHYDQIFQSYVLVPPSLAPYPKEATLRAVMAQAVERARVRLDAFEVSGTKFTATLAADKPIDPRVARYIDRANEFEGTTVGESRDEG